MKYKIKFKPCAKGAYAEPVYPDVTISSLISFFMRVMVPAPEYIYQSLVMLKSCSNEISYHSCVYLRHTRARVEDLQSLLAVCDATSSEYDLWLV